MTKIIVLHGGVDNSKPQSYPDQGEIAPAYHGAILPSCPRNIESIWRSMVMCGDKWRFVENFQGCKHRLMWKEMWSSMEMPVGLLHTIRFYIACHYICNVGSTVLQFTGQRGKCQWTIFMIQECRHHSFPTVLVFNGWMMTVHIKILAYMSVLSFLLCSTLYITVPYI